MRSDSSGSKPARRKHDDGFSLAEALAALVVLALAMGQVSEIMLQFIRSTSATKAAVMSANATAADLGRLETASAVIAKRQVKLGDQVFMFEDSSRPPSKPCLFDTIGRRCR